MKLFVCGMLEGEIYSQNELPSTLHSVLDAAKMSLPCTLHSVLDAAKMSLPYTVYYIRQK